MEIVFPTIREAHDLALMLHDRALEDDANGPVHLDCQHCMVGKILTAHNGQTTIPTSMDQNGEWMGFSMGTPRRCARFDDADRGAPMPEHLIWIEASYEFGHSGVIGYEPIADFADLAQQLRARYPEEFVGYESPECVRERLTAEKLQEAQS